MIGLKPRKKILFKKNSTSSLSRRFTNSVEIEEY